MAYSTLDFVILMVAFLIMTTIFNYNNNGYLPRKPGVGFSFETAFQVNVVEPLFELGMPDSKGGTDFIQNWMRDSDEFHYEMAFKSLDRNQDGWITIDDITHQFNPTDYELETANNTMEFLFGSSKISESEFVGTMQDAIECFDTTENTNSAFLFHPLDAVVRVRDCIRAARRSNLINRSQSRNAEAAEVFENCIDGEMHWTSGDPADDYYNVCHPTAAPSARTVGTPCAGLGITSLLSCTEACISAGSTLGELFVAINFFNDNTDVYCQCRRGNDLRPGTFSEWTTCTIVKCGAAEMTKTSAAAATCNTKHPGDSKKCFLQSCLYDAYEPVSDCGYMKDLWETYQDNLLSTCSVSTLSYALGIIISLFMIV